MILTADIGNTTVRICLVESRAGTYRVRAEQRFPTPASEAAERFSRELPRILNPDAALADGAVLCSVVPSLTGGIREALEGILGAEVRVFTREWDMGLTIGVERPELLGTDRLADAAYAAACFPKPLVTADLGTATTLNVVSEDNCFLGGVIAAGVSTMLSALSSNTACLPATEPRVPLSVIGADTASAMCSGAFYGTAALLEGLLARIENELGSKPAVILTGGFSGRVSPLCRFAHSLEPELLPRGLAYLYDRNF